MKELKNKGRQRWRDYICLFVSFLFVLYFGINYKSIIYNSNTLGNGIKILLLAGLVGNRHSTYFCEAGSKRKDWSDS